jgi:cell division transport system permease protein
LAVHAAMAANRPVIAVLRLVGAEDRFIARAFVQRLTWRTAAGTLLGVSLGLFALLLLPRTGAEGDILTGLGFEGQSWAWPFLLVPLAALVALLATARAAHRHLRDLP